MSYTISVERFRRELSSSIKSFLTDNRIRYSEELTRRLNIQRIISDETRAEIFQQTTKDSKIETLIKSIDNAITTSPNDSQTIIDIVLNSFDIGGAVGLNSELRDLTDEGEFMDCKHSLDVDLYRCNGID